MLPVQRATLKTAQAERELEIARRARGAELKGRRPRRPWWRSSAPHLPNGPVLDWPRRVRPAV